MSRREGTATAAAKAGDVHLDAGLREREEARPEPGNPLGTEDPPRELVERPLQVGQGDVGADGEPLDLVEDRAVGGVEGSER